MKPTRLLAVLALAVLVAAGVLTGVYYGTKWNNDLAPAYTKPDKMMEKWDGPGALPPPETTE